MALTTESALRKDKTTGKAEMQHRHFSTVAAILADLNAENAGVSIGQHRDICEYFADELATTNPRFDRDRFLKACGIE